MEPKPLPQGVACAQAFLHSLNQGGAGLAELIHPKGLIQHNPTLADGLYGLAMALHDCGSSPPHFDVMLSFEAPPYVVLVCTREASGFHIGVELFRLEDGLLREHWDNYCLATPSLIRPLRAEFASLRKGGGVVQGATATARAKRIVSAFMTDGVIKGLGSASWHLTPSAYKEWHAGTGLLMKVPREHVAEAINPWLFRMLCLHAVITNGRFALAISEGRSGSHATCHFSVFALDGNGIGFRMPIDELVPLSEFHRNPHGKFGIST